MSKDIGQKPEDWADEVLQEQPDSLLSRRGFIKRTAQLAVAGALIPGTLAQLVPALAPKGGGAGGPGPVINRDPVTNAKIPVTLADLDGPTPVEITAEWAFLPAKVFKISKSTLEGSSKARGYNTAMFAVEHPTEPDNAIVVYDGKCKHLGCTVGWNVGLGGSKDIPDYNEDGSTDGRILCPCHQGEYDIYDLARNQPGTPPPAPLDVIEFDVTSWTDELGTSHSDVILGTVKHPQDGYRKAEDSAEKMLDLKGTEFNIRKAGWFA